MSEEVGDVANYDGDESGQAGGKGKSKQLAVQLATGTSAWTTASAERFKE